MIIYGKNSILESLRAKKAVYKAWVSDKFIGQTGEIWQELKRANVKIDYVTKAELDKICGSDHHQGYVAELEDFVYCEPEDIIKHAESLGQLPFVVVLDGVEDPHNLGSVIRVCECAGVHGIIIPKHRACPINQTVVKTSAGAIQHMRVSKVTNLVQTLDKLKSLGSWVYGVELGGQDLYHTDLNGSIVLVIGSEGKGMGELMKKHCDGIVTIPMFGSVNSLNASVACGVAVFEVVRQRIKKK